MNYSVAVRADKRKVFNVSLVAFGESGNGRHHGSPLDESGDRRWEDRLHVFAGPDLLTGNGTADATNSKYGDMFIKLTPTPLLNFVSSLIPYLTSARRSTHMLRLTPRLHLTRF